MHTEQNITKVKKNKVKNGYGLVLTYEKKNNGDDVDGSEKHKALVHKDLQNALDGLGVHLACMTGYVKQSQVEDIAMPDPELFKNFHVNGYSIGGADDNQGVVISGHYILPGEGLAVILNTPFRRFDENPQSRYQFMDDLQARIQVIESEIDKYLDGSKRGEPVQQELAFDDDKNRGPLDANPEAMKRVAAMDKEPKAKKKKVAQSAEAPSGEVTE